LGPCGAARAAADQRDGVDLRAAVLQGLLPIEEPEGHAFEYGLREVAARCGFGENAALATK
jgi:hypothetical protein